MSPPWPWLSLALLGAYHGINPAMGWLFAVALGLQEHSRKALLRALLPIALGHWASIALTAALDGGLQVVSSPHLLRPLGAAALILFGLYKFLKPRWHPRWVGMRVSLRELVLWSFLMSSAHGAGLMLSGAPWPTGGRTPPSWKVWRRGRCRIRHEQRLDRTGCRGRARAHAGHVARDECGGHRRL